MKINELKEGDRITQQLDNTPISLEVISIRQTGRRFTVTFSSTLGLATASYRGDAHLTTV